MSALNTKAIAISHSRFRSGRDYHKQFLDEILPASGKVGEIGCSEGRIAAHYNTTERHFVAIDLDINTLLAAKSLRPEIDFVIGDAFNLPIPDCSLDAYIGLGIFELDGTRGNTCGREAARVIKSGGLLYITVPYKNIQRRLFARDATWKGQVVPTFNKAEATTLLSTLHFEVLLLRRSSIAHGIGPLGRLGRLFPNILDREFEKSLSYRIFGTLLKPLANSLLIVGRKK